jgi:hypothetical protein
MTTDDQSNPKTMSQEHKDALAKGRHEGRAVRDYLGALRDHKPKRGRKRTPDSIDARLTAIASELDEGVEPIEELRLVQERMDLLVERDHLANRETPKDHEEAFVQVAKDYSDRLNISYAAWREVGVDASVLKRAGIKRTAEV